MSCEFVNLSHFYATKQSMKRVNRGAQNFLKDTLFTLIYHIQWNKKETFKWQKTQKIYLKNVITGEIVQCSLCETAHLSHRAR